MNKKKTKDDDYRLRWDTKNKKLIKVSIHELEYDRIRKEHLNEKD